MTFDAKVVAVIRPLREKLGRAVPSLMAYLFTSILLIGAIALLDRIVGAQQLKAFLAYVLVATLAAGLEPGTAKAALVASSRTDKASLSLSLLGASLIKSVMVSPALAGIWLLSDREAIANGLLFVPVIAAIGFLATDIRVLLDAKGRYASAIWLKQGSLALAIACAATALALGHGLAAGILLSCFARLIWTVAFTRATADGQWARDRLTDHLLSNRWLHFLLASGLGSLAASIDRIVAFRMLDAASANAYILAYELLSKFWLLPYLLTPLAFVKATQVGPGGSFARQCHMLIAAAGLPFLLAATLLPLIPLQTLQSAAFTSWGLALFAGAILIAAFNQILSTELQASGSAAAATASATTGLFVSALAFPLLLWLMGFNGLFVAWMLKSLAESAVLGFATFRNRHA